MAQTRSESRKTARLGEQTRAPRLVQKFSRWLDLRVPVAQSVSERNIVVVTGELLAHATSNKLSDLTVDPRW